MNNEQCFKPDCPMPPRSNDTDRIVEAINSLTEAVKDSAMLIAKALLMDEAELAELVAGESESEVPQYTEEERRIYHLQRGHYPEEAQDE